MYSASIFSHKQIFSTVELAELLQEVGFEVVKLVKFHELSMPYEFYLRRLLRSNALTKIATPMAALFFVSSRSNKMLVVGRR